jgi:hypothetical protein
VGTRAYKMDHDKAMLEDVYSKVLGLSMSQKSLFFMQREVSYSYSTLMISS